MFCSQTGQSAPIYPASLASELLQKVEGGGGTHACVCVLGATREVSTGTLFLNLNNAHHEFSGGKLCAEGKDGGHAWVSLHQSPLPAKTTYWWHSRGKASSEWLDFKGLLIPGKKEVGEPNSRELEGAWKEQVSFLGTWLRSTREPCGFANQASQNTTHFSQHKHTFN